MSTNCITNIPTYKIFVEVITVGPPKISFQLNLIRLKFIIITFITSVT